MNDNDIKRISRINTIITQLQTNRVIASTAMLYQSAHLELCGLITKPYTF